MRILIVGLNFHPELTGIGKYTGELAAFLSGAGHQLRVITTPPYYPHWKVQPGYRVWQYRSERWQGIQVIRCPLWVPGKPSGFKRILHLLSFALSSLPVLFRQVFWRPQVVVCIAPALISAPFALAAARLAGARAWLHIQDFELEAAASLGLLESGNPLVRMAVFLEKRLLRAFDGVSTISEQMLSRLQAKGVCPERAVLFPNWVDPRQISPLPDSPEELRKGLGLPNGRFIALYSGNMGNKQGLETLIQTARQLEAEQGIHFVLCGEGSARPGLEQLAAGLRNVQFLALQPAEKLNQLLNAADIHLLPQRADAADLVMPSKLLGMLASGKPVIALAQPDTQLGRVIREVGFLAAPGDAHALRESLLQAARQPEHCRQLGARGREYVSERWGIEQVLRAFEARLAGLAGEALREEVVLGQGKI